MEASTKALAPEFPAAGAPQATIALRDPATRRSMFAHPPRYSICRSTRSLRNFSRAARFSAAEQVRRWRYRLGAAAGSSFGGAYELRAQIYISRQKIPAGVDGADELVSCGPEMQPFSMRVCMCWRTITTTTGLLRTSRQLQWFRRQRSICFSKMPDEALGEN